MSTYYSRAESYLVNCRNHKSISGVSISKMVCALGYMTMIQNRMERGPRDFSGGFRAAVVLRFFYRIDQAFFDQNAINTKE